MSEAEQRIRDAIERVIGEDMPETVSGHSSSTVAKPDSIKIKNRLRQVQRRRIDQATKEIMGELEKVESSVAKAYFERKEKHGRGHADVFLWQLLT